MNKKLSLKLAIVSFAIAALALGGLVYEINSVYAADEGMKVIGKATITKGTELNGIVTLGPDTVMPFSFVAFEDQELYVIGKIDPKEGVHKGGYVLDASGFAHTCPVHGKEVMGEASAAVSTEMVDEGIVTIILFEELGTIKGN